MTLSNKILGIVLIVLGIIVFFGFLADLLFKLLIAFFGLYIINYGLKLLGKPSLFYMITSWWALFQFRNFR